jgi:hypothetical protein
MARIKSLANSLVEGKEMEATLVPKGGQRAEWRGGKGHDAGARARVELLAKYATFRPAELT